MALTTEQIATLKTAIDADPTMSAYPMNGDGYFDLALYLNQPHDSTFIVWRGPMPVNEIEQNGFAWNQLDQVPAAKYRIWERLTSSGFINPTKQNVRSGINDFCKDASNATITSLRDSILPHLKAQATRVQQILATGTGTDAVPATMGFVGPISAFDVQTVRNS